MSQSTALEVIQRIGWSVDRNGCWNWQGRIRKDGYGHIAEYMDKHFGHMVHRVAYCNWVGEPPDGWELDHNCNNRGCINPGRKDLGGYGRRCKLTG